MKLINYCSDFSEATKSILSLQSYLHWQKCQFMRTKSQEIFTKKINNEIKVLKQSEQSGDKNTNLEETYQHVTILQQCLKK